MASNNTTVSLPHPPRIDCWEFHRFYSECAGVTTRTVCRNAAHLFANGDWVHPSTACKPHICDHLVFQTWHPGLCPDCAGPAPTPHCNDCSVEQTSHPHGNYAGVARWGSPSDKTAFRRLNQRIRAASDRLLTHCDDLMWQMGWHSGTLATWPPAGRALVQMYLQHVAHIQADRVAAAGNSAPVTWALNAQLQNAALLGYVCAADHACGLPYTDTRDRCLICYGDIDGPSARRLPCGHVFHQGCLFRMLREQWPAAAAGELAYAELSAV
jgi:hypothetical protein